MDVAVPDKGQATFKRRKRRKKKNAMQKKTKKIQHNFGTIWVMKL